MHYCVALIFHLFFVLCSLNKSNYLFSAGHCATVKSFIGKLFNQYFFSNIFYNFVYRWVLGEKPCDVIETVPSLCHCHLFTFENTCYCCNSKKNYMDFFFLHFLCVSYLFERKSVQLEFIRSMCEHVFCTK